MLRDVRAPKGQEPLTKKEMKEACGNLYAETKRKLRQGFGKAPLFYYVLRVQQLCAKDQKIVDKGLTVCSTPDECRALISKQVGWSYRDISLVKDFECGVLLYKGLAVAVYYKRQVTKIEPGPLDPIPSGALENLEDVWARLDLNSKSPRQLVGSVKTEILEKDQQILDLQQQLKATEILLEAANKKLTDKRQLVKPGVHPPGWRSRKK